MSPESRNELKAFGLRVRKLREELGWSQDKLAEEADLHRTYISGLERGERNVSVGKHSSLGAGAEDGTG